MRCAVLAALFFTAVDARAQGEPAPSTPTEEQSVPTEGGESAPASSDTAKANEVESETKAEDDDAPKDAGVAGEGPLGKLPPTEEIPDRLQGEVAAPRGGLLTDYLDTRLSFSFSDDDWLSGPGESTPSSPGADFSPRSANRFFFDQLNRRDTGYETLTHLVLYRRQAGFIPGMDTEAALVARLNLVADDDTGLLSTQLRDDGTYLRLRYFFSGSTADEKALHVDLVMFPFSTERFRLGYLYDVSWAGNGIFPKPGVAVPGAKLQLAGQDGYVYVGAKTARLLNQDSDEIEAHWGLLTGAGWDFFDVFQIDVGGGYFDRGLSPKAGVEDQHVQGFGGSTRLALHLGRDVPSSIDFRLYRHDPAMTDLFRISSKSKTGTSFLLSAEYSLLGQTLQDTTNLRSTVIQPAQAGALSAKLGVDDWAVGADAIYRDLAFATFNGPNFTPYVAFPQNALVTPEFLVALSTSYFIEPARLTPGLVLGFQAPASFAGLDPSFLDSDLQDVSGNQVVVVRDLRNREILACLANDPATGECTRARQPEPIYAIRLALKWDVSDLLALVGETTVLVDNNVSEHVDSAGGIVERAPRSNFDPGVPLLPLTSNPYNIQLAAGLFAQARF